MTGKHYPTIKGSIFLLISLFLVMIGLVLILMITGLALGGIKLNQVGDLFIKNPQYMGMFNLVAICLTAFWGYKRTQAPYGQVFPLRPVPGSIFLPIGLVMMGLAILLSDLDNLLRWVLHTPPDQNDPLIRLFSSNNTWGLAFFLVVVAPLTEEFLFRGLVLTGFVNNYRVTKAIWVSALLFAVFHMNIYQMPGAFLAGLVFAWLVVKTGSLWPSLFGHALTNGLPIIAERVLNLKIAGFTYQLENQILFQPLWLDGIGLALVGLGIWLLAPKLKESLEPARELLRNQAPAVEIIEAPEGPAENPPGHFGKQGLASLIIGIISSLALVGSLVLAVSIYKHNNLYLAGVVGLTILMSLVASMIGIGLGVAGVIKKQRQTMAWIGIVLNGFYLLMWIVIIIVGVMNYKK